MTDRYLQKVQVLTTNNCFGRSITSWNYIILILWTETLGWYSVGRWVSGRLVGGSVVSGFNETQEKTCFEWWFRLCHLVKVYFVILILIFCILTIKKKQIWLPEAVTGIFSYSWRYISIITKQSDSLLEFHQIFVLFIRSCYRRSKKASVLLKNSSWYIHS